MGEFALKKTVHLEEVICLEPLVAIFAMMCFKIMNHHVVLTPELTMTKGAAKLVNEK